MGGAVSLTVAETYPDWGAATASFHGGNLAMDSELSPHRLAQKMKGRIYTGVADQDSSYPPEMAEQLEKSLSEAGVDHRCEIYRGAPPRMDDSGLPRLRRACRWAAPARANGALCRQAGVNCRSGLRAFRPSDRHRRLEARRHLAEKQRETTSLQGLR